MSKVIPQGPKTLKIFDISHYEPSVDWKMVGAHPEWAGVAIKATDGVAGKDAKTQSHLAGARSVQLPALLYHFFRYGQDPLKQAQNLASVAGPGHKGDGPLIVDVEWDNSQGQGGPYANGKQIDDAAAKKVLACMAELKRLLPGRKLGIYCAASFFDHIVDDSLRTAFKEFLLWVAFYEHKNTAGGEIETGMPAGAPKCPAPWDNWFMWQFTDHALVPGIGKIDMSLFNGDEAALQALLVGA